MESGLSTTSAVISPAAPAARRGLPSMTRRVVIAIIINVWLVLLTAGCSTYFITRSLLLSDLDDSIVSRVASLPGMEPTDVLPHLAPSDTDRYVIQDASGQKWSSLTKPPESHGGPAPVILTRGFSQMADGTQLRTLTLRAFLRGANPGDPPVPVTVVYSASAGHVNELLWKLLYSFFFFGILAAVVSALTARSAAKAALRPMRETAEVIGKINERSLNRRLDLSQLPPELAPVGAKLNDMLARLETAFAQRRQFLANASHELRTPVAALVTALEVALRRRRENDEYIRVLDQSLADARLLNHLVVTLVEQARLDRLGDSPEYAPVMLSLFLRRCAATLNGPAQKKGIQLDCDIREDATVFVDEGMLRSAVLNLLSNAVEYTPVLGKVTLAARLTDPGGPLPDGIGKSIPEGVEVTPRGLEITVEDNGPGIKPEHMESIFEPFFRADPSRSADSHHHLGLGLASVRLGLRSMGGDATVRSPPPGGSSGCVFRLLLPTAIARVDRKLSEPVPNVAVGSKPP